MRNCIKTNQTGRSLRLSCAKDTPSSFERRVQMGYTSEKVASRFAQTGRSMIEMLGVLAIIGVLSVGGIAGYSKAMMKYRTNKTIEQIAMVNTNIQTLFANQKDYYGVDNGEVLLKAKVLPEEMIKDNCIRTSGPTTCPKYLPEYSIITSLGEPIYISSTSKNKQSDGFIIVMYKIPLEACITLMTQDWGNGKQHSVADASDICVEEDDINNILVWGFDMYSNGGSVDIRRRGGCTCKFNRGRWICEGC